MKNTHLSSTKPWYRTWWGILLLVLLFPFFPFFLLWYAWTQSAWKLPVKVLATIVGIGWIGAYAVNGQNNGPREPIYNTKKVTTESSQEPTTTAIAIAPDTTTAPTPTPTPAPSQTIVTTPTPTPAQKEQKSTLSLLWEALDETIKTRDGFDINYSDLGTTAVLTREPRTYYDETAMVKEGYSNLVKYGQKAFTIEGVDEVELTLFNTFTDSYGKESRQKALQLRISKDEFSKYEWKNLAGQNIFTQMKDSCSVHYIHAGVMKNVKTDKLTLVL